MYDEPMGIGRRIVRVIKEPDFSFLSTFFRLSKTCFT